MEAKVSTKVSTDKALVADEERERMLAALLSGNSFAKEGEADEDYEPPPEDCIPDLPENAEAREFLKNAPSKGLYMPLGKSVKVMQCWRCKAYGHRTGDAECPMARSGNFVLDSQRAAREDPMATFQATKMMKRKEKYERVAQLMELMVEIREEERQRKKRKKEKSKKHKSSKSKRDGSKRSKRED
jgi:retinitis pigmentosa 9 protein